MATLREALESGWADCVWSLGGDDYVTLRWSSTNPREKPEEADIRAFAAIVAADQIIAAQADAVAKEIVGDPATLDAVIGISDGLLALLDALPNSAFAGSGKPALTDLRAQHADWKAKAAKIPRVKK